MTDGRVIENRPADMNWDGIWHAKTRIDDQGWTAELEIPFKTLSFKPEVGVWGFNIERTLARMNEESRREDASPHAEIHTVGRAGDLEGSRACPRASVWTSNLLSSTTINTDFAETEVDTRQVNLTRFPLLFPEKRDFFLEDAGVFQFGLPTNASTLMPFRFSNTPSPIRAPRTDPCLSPSGIRKGHSTAGTATS